MLNWAKKFVEKIPFYGASSERYLKKIRPLVERINHLENEWNKLSDEELQKKTENFKERLSKGESLDALLPETFATVREASRRLFGKRHFDVQLLGGIVLHEGKIAEMGTGEGKTLCATLPVYLNALTGQGVHVVTVNDYLAKRDATQMGRLYGFLGLSTGCIVHGLTDKQRYEAYHSDITYGTNNEFGFDYLRDNMKYRKEERCQRPFSFAIVDEVDSILIDEARTPLIISGPSEETSELYAIVDQLILELIPEDYEKDEKLRSVALTEKGSEHVEKLAQHYNLLGERSLYDVHNAHVVHHIQQALKAHVIFKKDVDYIVKEGEVVIIDENTGREMPGRRYSDGLHQALEAKEHVEVENENQTLASITFQNYFRLYPKLSGMTGTAKTDETEFVDVYKLRVIEVPPHRPVKRIDHNDEIYRTFQEKLDAIIALVEQCYARKQPVLIGTTSIEKSEIFSEALKQQKIPHHVLNARHHAKEAQIIAQAGVPGAVTIATNMAGRGTDIVLGGSLEEKIEASLQGVEFPEERLSVIEQITQEWQILNAQVKEAGGLFVIGTERQESRRIDNQLRGRSGRQGDPGASKFFMSLEDDLMRIFASDRLSYFLQKAGLKHGEPIEHLMINRSVEKAQKKVQLFHFDTRKSLLKYDDVMNEQRQQIYTQRREIMEADTVHEDIRYMGQEVLGRLIASFTPPDQHSDQWNLESLHEEVLRILGVDLSLNEWMAQEEMSSERMHEKLFHVFEDIIHSKEEKYGAQAVRYMEKTLYLSQLDHVWKNHLLALDHLRQGIHLRAYGQKDPFIEFKHEAFELFSLLVKQLQEKIISQLCHSTMDAEPSSLDFNAWLDSLAARQPDFAALSSYQEEEEDAKETHASGDFTPPPSRNALCPCGSGKRYKACHGKLA